MRIGRQEFATMTQKSQAYHITQAKQMIDKLLSHLCPHGPDQLWNAIVQKEVAEKKLTQVIAEAYSQANCASDKLQLLSLLATSRSFSECQQEIEDLTKSAYYRAQVQAKKFGAGSTIAVDRESYVRYNPISVEHFIDYVLSFNVVSDLPFGETTMKLSNGQVIAVPNVIRDAIPERIIRQYRAYCEEEIKAHNLPSDFLQLQRTSLLRILDVCKASKRKALQGEYRKSLLEKYN